MRERRKKMQGYRKNIFFKVIKRSERIKEESQATK